MCFASWIVLDLSENLFSFCNVSFADMSRRVKRFFMFGSGTELIFFVRTLWLGGRNVNRWLTKQLQGLEQCQLSHFKVARLLSLLGVVCVVFWGIAH